MLRAIPVHLRLRPVAERLRPSSLSLSSSYATTSHPPPRKPQMELTLALLKPGLCSYQPDVSLVLKTIKASELQVVRTKRIFWRVPDAEKFYEEHRGRFFFERLVTSMTSAPFMALALYGPDAIAKWRAMMGPTKAYRAKWEGPESLRGRFGTSDTRNGFHGSDSPESAARELSLLFDGWDTAWWMEREAKAAEAAGR